MHDSVLFFSYSQPPLVHPVNRLSPFPWSPSPCGPGRNGCSYHFPLSTVPSFVRPKILNLNSSLPAKQSFAYLPLRLAFYHFLPTSSLLFLNFCFFPDIFFSCSPTTKVHHYPPRLFVKILVWLSLYSFPLLPTPVSSL